MTSSVYVVDDDPAVREGLLFLLKGAGFEAKCFSSGKEFLDAYRPDMSGCLILDVKMPEMTGQHLHEELLRRGGSMRIIYLTGHGDIPMSVRSIKAGADDFLTKPVNGEDLINCVRRSLDVAREQSSREQALKERSDCLNNLTSRELEILMMVTSGLASKEIAQKLNISPRTVELHRSHILLRTGKSNMVELAELVGELHLRERNPTDV